MKYLVLNLILIIFSIFFLKYFYRKRSKKRMNFEKKIKVFPKSISPLRVSPKTPQFNTSPKTSTLLSLLKTPSSPSSPIPKQEFHKIPIYDYKNILHPNKIKSMFARLDDLLHMGETVSLKSIQEILAIIEKEGYTKEPIYIYAVNYVYNSIA
jgi:hypothetical protein